MKLVCMPLVAGVLATASFADIYVWESFSDPSGGVNAPTGGNGSGDPSVVVVDGAWLALEIFTVLPELSPCTFMALGLSTTPPWRLRVLDHHLMSQLFT